MINTCPGMTLNLPCCTSEEYSGFFFSFPLYSSFLYLNMRINLQNNTIYYQNDFCSLFISLDNCNEGTDNEECLNLKFNNDNGINIELIISKERDSVYMKKDNLQIFEVSSEIYLYLEWGFLFFITFNLLTSKLNKIPPFGFALFSYLMFPKWLLGGQHIDNQLTFPDIL